MLKSIGLGMVAHAFNTSTREAEAGESLELEASLVYIVSSRLGLHSGTLSPKGGRALNYIVYLMYTQTLAF